MTREDKKLLLKDLCTRLPYGVKVYAKYVDADTEVEKVGVLSMVDNDTVIAFTCDDTNCYNYVAIHEVKPYLFPLSSMTEEQKKEFDQLLELELKAINDEIDHVQATAFEVDFYNKHHFDWRGLIPKGLAIDATGLNIY
jgi:hypothetical protein